MQDFLENFAEQFDDTPADQITHDTNFKDLDEWSSMTALTIIAMVDEKYGKKLSGSDIREASTVQDLIALIEKK